jgi:phosphoribosylglycinamide formyltransferase-1
MEFNTQKIVVFASGSGSNAEQIIQHFANQPNIRVAKIYVNKPDAFVIERAKRHQIETKVFDRSYFLSHQGLISDLSLENPDLIVLAGFLWKIPEMIVKAYPNKIINIHPALLPKFGGKGMFGMHVHRAVIATGESESGITIHYVNENYDEGAIIMQAKFSVAPSETPESLAQKIHKLEHQHYPVAIEKILTSS